MGIDTYFLWGGNWNSFWTKEAINNTVEYVFKQLEATGEVGVDLDFEHPETWGPDFADPLNKSFAAELTSKYSNFLRTLSSALHERGFKMSECVGSYPTRDGGIAVYYDPAVRVHASQRCALVKHMCSHTVLIIQVVGETNDLVRVMNYDM